MKIAFFTVKHISHIKPIIHLVSKLQQNNHNIYVFGTAENKHFFDNINITNYISYQFDIGKNSYEKIANNELQKSIEVLYQNRDFIESHKHYIYQDIISSHVVEQKSLDNISKCIKEINPDIIIRDSVDLYGLTIAQQQNIRIFSYITNNLYNWDYFKKNRLDWYIFFGLLDVKDKLPTNYFSNFKYYIYNLYKKFEEEYNAIAIRPYHNFNIHEELNIILSTNFLQPIDSLTSINYVILNPPLEKYRIENDIPASLKSFINQSTNKKIVYIATGSFINNEINFYKHIIKQMIKLQYRIIISAGNLSSTLNQYIFENSLQEHIYCDRFLPQNYVLLHSDLFISSGGFNSILEAIYYKVPIIIRPITCEQRMNGIIMERIGLGVTQYSTKKRTIIDEINIVTSQKVKNTMIKYNKKLLNHNNDNSFKYILDKINIGETL